MIGLPVAIWPSLRMSARRPPRWMSGRSKPGPWSRSRWAQGSARRRPRQWTSPMRKSRPTRALTSMPRVRMLRRVLAKSSAASRAGEFLDHFGGDQGQLVPGPVCAAGTERAGAVGVAVTLQATAGQCAGLLDQLHGCCDERCDGEQLDDAGHRGAFLCHGEHGVERRDGVGAADVEVGGGMSEQRRVLRTEDDAGWCPEREDGDLPLETIGEGAVGEGAASGGCRHGRRWRSTSRPTGTSGGQR